MVETDTEYFTKLYDVDDFEKTDQVIGNRTYFAGANINFKGDVIDPAISKLVGKYLVTFMTTNALNGVPLDIHYRKVRVPSDNQETHIENFFTNVQVGFISQFFAVARQKTSRYSDYDIFFTWSPGGIGPTNLDLWITSAKLPNGDGTIQTPTFPNSTDPVNGGAIIRSKSRDTLIFDTFFVALPAP